MRTIVRLFIVLAFLAVAGSAAVGQEATPVDSLDSDWLLAGLGMPELAVSVDSETFEIPAEVEANRYRLVVTNASAQYISDMLFLRIPEGMAVDVAVALAVKAAASDAPSEEFYNFTFIGGTTTFPESVSEVIITLAPGSYVAMNVRWDVEDPEAVGPSPVVSFEVTGSFQSSPIRRHR